MELKILFLLLTSVSPASPATLLSYGDNNMNDLTATEMSDDSSLEITTTTPLNFYGNSYTSLWLGSNGYVALQETVAFANAIPTPLNLKLIAPLFDDLRPSGTGNIFYRQTSDAADNTAASESVNGLFPEESPYTATYVLVVTWSEYQKFAQPGLLTFQAVITTDGTKTFAVFLYQQLTTGLTADVGIDAGDGTNYYKLCLGGDPNIESLPLLRQSCNVDPGVFGFRIDVANPSQDTYTCTASLEDVNCTGCPDLTDPDNGSVDMSAGTAVGDNATYTCLEGYELIGDTMRECLSDNTWSGAEPVCQIIPKCPALTDPDYGTVDVPATRQVGDIATYSCISGYDLIGNYTRECEYGNDWSGSEPTCQSVATYYCAWNDTGQTLVDIIFTINLPGVNGITAVDTQKYEDGDDPTISDSTCSVVYTTDPTTLAFTVNPYAATPACGVRATTVPNIVLDIIIRVYHDDTNLDVNGDRIYSFNCTTNTILPRIVTQSKEFNDNINVTAIPPATRSLQLLVITPQTDDIVTVAKVGELIQLRIIYDNTASNVEPYGVYVTDCTVADTITFDASTVTLIQAGCTVEQTPAANGYMSRSFQQRSLSPAGLFISDSGSLSAFRFVNKDKVFFRCVVEFCFFLSTAPNLCTDSCTGSGRRKRSGSIANQQLIYASLQITAPAESEVQRSPSEDCISSVVVYTTLASLGFLVLASLTLSCFLFCKLMKIRNRKVRSRILL